MKVSSIKKIVVTLLLGCLLFVFAGCGNTDLTMGEVKELGGKVEITPENVLVSSQVFPPVWSEEPMGWVTNGTHKTYLTFVAKVKNLQEDALTVNDLWQAFSLYAKTEYTDCDIVAIVTKDGTCLDDDAEIKSGKTRTVYFIKEIEEIDRYEQMEAVFDFDGAPKARIAFDGKRNVAVYEELSLKSPIKAENFGTVEISDVGFVEKLSPENPGYIYDYYAPKSEDEKLLLIEAEVENTSKKNQYAASYLNVVAFADGYEYYGDLLLETQYTVQSAAGEQIEAKDTCKVVGAVSLPKTLKLEDLDIFVYVNGAYYRFDG